MPKTLSKKARKELETKFTQYSTALEFSATQINKLIGEGKQADADKEAVRYEKLNEEQKKIGAQL